MERIVSNKNLQTFFEYLEVDLLQEYLRIGIGYFVNALLNAHPRLVPLRHWAQTICLPRLPQRPNLALLFQSHLFWEFFCVWTAPHAQVVDSEGSHRLGSAPLFVIKARTVLYSACWGVAERCEALPPKEDPEGSVPLFLDWCRPSIVFSTSTALKTLTTACSSEWAAAPGEGSSGGGPEVLFGVIAEEARPPDGAGRPQGADLVLLAEAEEASERTDRVWEAFFGCQRRRRRSGTPKSTIFVQRGLVLPRWWGWLDTCSAWTAYPQNFQKQRSEVNPEDLQIL